MPTPYSISLQSPAWKRILPSFPRSAWERKSGRSAARPVGDGCATQSVANLRSHHAERGNERRKGSFPKLDTVKQPRTTRLAYFPMTTEWQSGQMLLLAIESGAVSQ
jgi:hypothetical protein